MKQFIVIGLGRFGGSVTKTLASLGYEVLAIDKEKKRIQEYASICSHVYQADSTDESILVQLGLRNFDQAIVAIGSDLQASILTTMILKELGVKKVTAKANDELHQKMLERIGADPIVHPERDTGVRLAHQVTSNNLIDFIEISPDLV